jgi:pyruvate formate-lyase activating enzyme-like uncharacterized protein
MEMGKIKDYKMGINGCEPFSNKKEKLRIWKELKQEFGENIKIIIEDHLITYTTVIDRTNSQI